MKDEKLYGVTVKCCPVCGKKIYRQYFGNWHWKLLSRVYEQGHENTLYFCGYNCMRVVEKVRLAEDKRRKDLQELLYHARHPSLKAYDRIVVHKELESDNVHSYTITFPTGHEAVGCYIQNRSKHEILISAHTLLNKLCTQEEMYDQVYLIMQNENLAEKFYERFKNYDSEAQLKGMYKRLTITLDSGDLGTDMAAIHKVENVVRILARIYKGVKIKILGSPKKDSYSDVRFNVIKADGIDISWITSDEVGDVIQTKW